MALSQEHKELEFNGKYMNILRPLPISALIGFNVPGISQI